MALRTAVMNYLRSANPARGTQAEYMTTVRKWKRWGGGVPIENLGRTEIREFLDWVYERVIAEHGSNPGRTANKAREHLRAVVSWAWDRELIESPPRFPKPKHQRDVAGRHYLTKPEINALYFATYRFKETQMARALITAFASLAMISTYAFAEEFPAVTKEHPTQMVPHFFCFDYPAGDEPGKRIWLRIDDKTWVERYPNRALIHIRESGAKQGRPRRLPP
jgi:hypothetical protein